MVTLGIEQLCVTRPDFLKGKRLALLCNQASTDRHFTHSRDLVNAAFPGQLTCLFSPQHGFFAEKQDNMIESDHRIEPQSGRTIYSLYGATRKPTPEMMAGLDALLIDLVDVGTRVYTFAQTTAYCLEAAAAAGVDVVILDRPNPIGGAEVEGHVLQPDCASFVGLFPIPMRHGLTLGELARFMADRLPDTPRPEVIAAAGWRREMYFPGTGLPWVPPSPNMPTPETAWVYPGQVLWEGTNVSEGRGTTRPFHVCGAPFIDPYALRDDLASAGIEGAVFRPTSFEPTFHKFRGEVCHGVEIHPIDPRTFRPCLTSLTILESILRRWPDRFSFRPPPYEYEYERQPIDLILGDRRVREGLLAGRSARDIAGEGDEGVAAFLEAREKCLLY